MSDPGSVYERLRREHQVGAQRFMFRFVVPLLCVVGPLFIWADGPDYKSVFVTVGGYSCLTAILVDAWRTRRGLPSYWEPKGHEQGPVGSADA